MNTILTDDERPKLPQKVFLDNAKHHGWGHTDEALKTYADAREAAVLAKLREQEPVAQPTAEMLATFKAAFEGGSIWTARVNHALAEVFRSHKLYAAPLPAVVQVPQGWKLVPVEPTEEMIYAAQCEGNPELNDEYMAADYKAMLAAAPEAPAQGDPLEKLTRIQEELRLYDDKPAQPSVPAPWREVVKVMREALAEEKRVRLLGQEPDVHWESMRDVRRDCYAATDAAIALADSLEGGE